MFVCDVIFVLKWADAAHVKWCAFDDLSSVLGFIYPKSNGLIKETEVTKCGQNPSMDFPCSFPFQKKRTTPRTEILRNFFWRNNRLILRLYFLSKRSSRRWFRMNPSKCSTRGTIHILSLGNTECSHVPSDICTRKFDIFYYNHLQNVLSFERYLCCLQWLENCVKKNGINSWKFSCNDLLRLLTWLIETRVHRPTYPHFWRLKPHPMPLWHAGITSLIVTAIRSPTNFVKIVQNQLSG